MYFPFCVKEQIDLFERRCKVGQMFLKNLDTYEKSLKFDQSLIKQEVATISLQNMFC